MRDQKLSVFLDDDEMDALEDVRRFLTQEYPYGTPLSKAEAIRFLIMRSWSTLNYDDETDRYYEDPRN